MESWNIIMLFFCFIPSDTIGVLVKVWGDHFSLKVGVNLVSNVGQTARTCHIILDLESEITMIYI